MTRRVPRGTLVLAGMAAGVAVGLVDGAWAAVTVGTDVWGGLAAALLVAGVDGVLGAGGGLVVEAAARLSRWGRLARPGRWARVLATMAIGLAVCAATFAAASGTIDRRNRFLAGGVAVTVAFAAGVAGMALLPALARFLSLPRGSSVAAGSRHRVILSPGLLLCGPLAVVAVGVVIMSAVVELRPPLSSPRAFRHLMLAGLEAGLLPALLCWAESLPLRIGIRWAAPLAVVVFGGPLSFLALRNWDDHLRFIPWTHVVPAIVLAAIALGNTPVTGYLLRSQTFFRRAAVGAVGVAILAILILATSESETARKVTSAHAGLVGPVLAEARRALDRDHDGYPRLLGGGDCDDGDPTVHPGVLDFPDDGIDQDCDGKDASVSALVPPPFAAVPDTVPANLNLLLVTIDTVRADHLGCYGYARPTSPAIDRLATEGALFLNGWAHAPSTRYSMPAIATGRWPTAIAWDESIWWPRIAPTVPTLAETLKARGYFTAAFYSFEYFSAADRRGFERGVDLYRTDRAALHQAVNGPMESRGSSSREMADDAIAFLETHRDGRFFLWVHFYDPHLSYEPHPEVPSFGPSRLDLYDGEIRFTDLHLGRVLERLRALDLWNHTAIVVTGDHGEGFGEHGVTEHGFDLYAAQTKVPLIMRVPGLSARRIVTPAGHVDLAPTLVNLARGPQPPTFLGRSLVSELAGGAPSVPPPVAVFQEVTSERGKKRALVTQDLHLIWNWTPDNTTECYDTLRDPTERRDLWGRSGDGGCRRLKADLQGMVSALSVPPDVARQLKSSVFSPGAPAPAIAQSIDGTVGELITVNGYTLIPGSGSPVPGGDVEIAVLFTCRRPITGGWRLFFHMKGPGGAFRNLDHVPVEGAMPLERWRPGQRIVDRMRIPFPVGTPRGAYQVIVGLFRGGERLPITPAALSDGNKALRLATIRVP